MGNINIYNVIDTTEKMEGIDTQINGFVDQIRAILERPNGVSIGNINIENVFTDRVVNAEGVSEDDLERLRRSAEDMYAADQPPRHPQTPFQFTATILNTNLSQGENTNVCVQYDTASTYNWVAASIVKRLGLQERIRPIEMEGTARGADGSRLRYLGVIRIAWTYNSVKSWELDFLVNDTPTYDMLLGVEFILKEGQFVFSDPVLAHDFTRLAPLTSAESRQMEHNMRERGIENETLSQSRAARDAAKRLEKRKAIAASRNSLSGSRMSLAATPGTMTPISTRPTSPLGVRSNSVTTTTTDADEAMVASIQSGTSQSVAGSQA
ncbi:hypothetical protein GQ44DRAFT_731312 [Phaeosphaeriaceae sp. PMI808]|nr:hypothetical protein GQ44DRAFT_731312 [Phaeosphaeriaceae sp. PMI808]